MQSGGAVDWVNDAGLQLLRSLSTALPRCHHTDSSALRCHWISLRPADSAARPPIRCMLRLRCQQLLARSALAPCTQPCLYAAASSAAATAVAATPHGGRALTAASQRRRSLHTAAVRRSSTGDGGSSSQLPHAANDATAATTATATAAVPPPHPPDTPPPPAKGRLRDLARRAGSAGISVGRGAWAAMRAPQQFVRKRPLATLLLALALALGAGWAIRRRTARQRERAALLAQQQAAMLSGQPAPAVVPEAVAKESHTVGAFVRPRWATSPPLKDLAALLNAMPQLAQQLRVGQQHQPLQCETTLSAFSSNNALTPVMTPAEAMEKLRVLLLDGQSRWLMAEDLWWWSFHPITADSSLTC